MTVVISKPIGYQPNILATQGTTKHSNALQAGRYNYLKDPGISCIGPAPLACFFGRVLSWRSQRKPWPWYWPWGICSKQKSNCLMGSENQENPRNKARQIFPKANTARSTPDPCKGMQFHRLHLFAGSGRCIRCSRTRRAFSKGRHFPNAGRREGPFEKTFSFPITQNGISEIIFLGCFDWALSLGFRNDTAFLLRCKLMSWFWHSSWIYFLSCPRASNPCRGSVWVYTFAVNKYLKSQFSSSLAIIFSLEGSWIQIV